MDLLNSVSQCHFCSHLNTAFSAQCELCHELLSVQNMLLVTELMSPPSSTPLCRHCNRRLLHNQRSCAFCNARWAFRPISRLASLDALHMDLIRLAVLPTVTSLAVPPGRGDEEPGLSQAARDRYLTLISVDSSCTTALCPVCLELVAATEDSQVHVVQLPCCRNKFHAACVQPWFVTHSSCPTCRQNLNNLVTS